MMMMWWWEGSRCLRCTSLLNEYVALFEDVLIDKDIQWKLADSDWLDTLEIFVWRECEAFSSYD